ncbi:MAG: DUF2914 domain-containing protein [Chromatiaceae bacterium]|jgi:hypothetical protein|nr:DUF2914 domain-containing protein [Chromatiaceae bacterium]
MKPEWNGGWEVEVIDGGGRIIGRSSFIFETPL